MTGAYTPPPPGGLGMMPFMSQALSGIGNSITCYWGGPGSGNFPADPGAIMRESLDKGHPVILAGSVFGWGHLLVVRGYVEAPGGTQWIVNDPFGFRTKGKFGGGNAVYEWAEMNPRTLYVISGEGRPA